MKLKKLSENISEAAKNEKSGLLVIPLGVFLINAGLIISLVGSHSAVFYGGVFATILGILSTLLGFFLTAHYSHQYNRLLEELDALQKDS